MDVAPAPGPNPTRPPPTRPASTSGPTPQTAPRSAPATGPTPSAPQINCFCGKPSAELTVKKESANKGRHFRRCGQPQSCDFFEWTDEPPRDGGSMMKHGGGPPNPPSIPAKRPRADDAVRVLRMTSSASPNNGAIVFFLHQATRKYCRCDLTAVLKIVKNDGPNKGRHFWSCPNSQAASCNFFEWEDDPATGVAAAPLNARTQSAGSQQTTGECFNVSKPMCRLCPNLRLADETDTYGNFISSMT